MTLHWCAQSFKGQNIALFYASKEHTHLWRSMYQKAGLNRSYMFQTLHPAKRRLSGPPALPRSTAEPQQVASPGSTRPSPAALRKVTRTFNTRRCPRSSLPGHFPRGCGGFRGGFRGGFPPPPLPESPPAAPTAARPNGRSPHSWRAAARLAQPDSRQPAQYSAPAAPRRPLRSGAPRPARPAPANERRARARVPPRAPIREGAAPPGGGGSSRPAAGARAPGSPRVPHSREPAPAASVERAGRRSRGGSPAARPALGSRWLRARSLSLFPKGPARAELPSGAGPERPPQRQEAVSEGGGVGAGDGLGRPVRGGSGPSDGVCGGRARKRELMRTGGN